MAYSFFFFFFLLSSIVTQRSSLTFDLLFKRHESDLVRSQSTLLSEQSEEFRLFPLQFHGLPQGTRHIYIYIYIHYRPIRSSSVVQGIYNNLPVMLSQSIRDVMILPYGLNRFSRSCCVMFFGKPLTYKFAPLIASLLGLAYDTCIIIN